MTKKEKKQEAIREISDVIEWLSRVQYEKIANLKGDCFYQLKRKQIPGKEEPYETMRALDSLATECRDMQEALTEALDDLGVE